MTNRQTLKSGAGNMVLVPLLEQPVHFRLRQLPFIGAIAKGGAKRSKPVLRQLQGLRVRASARCIKRCA